MSRWKRELDDADRENLAHLINLGKVLETHTPESIIEWNKHLMDVPEHKKRKPKKRRKR